MWSKGGKRKQDRLTEQDKWTIAGLVIDKVPYQEISKRFEISNNTIYEITLWAKFKQEKQRRKEMMAEAMQKDDREHCRLCHEPLGDNKYYDYCKTCWPKIVERRKYIHVR